MIPGPVRIAPASYQYLDPRRAGFATRMLKRIWELTYRQARRLVVLMVGVSVLLFGVALIFLPGPAIVVIPAGLAILSLEFAWARAFLLRIRREISARNRQLRMNRSA
jgi:uncharacterized protein (TIGR02611 family)